MHDTPDTPDSPEATPSERPAEAAMPIPVIVATDPGTLSPARLALLRERVRDGTYESAEVFQAVAKALRRFFSS